MKRSILKNIAAWFSCFSAGVLVLAAADAGVLSAAGFSANQKGGGWIMLFDGKTSRGWRGAKLKSFPQFGWRIEDGELAVLKSQGDSARRGGDIITAEQHDNFELSVEFKLTPGANSGIKYMVVGLEPGSKGSVIGLEYQILDDSRHPDAKKGVGGNRTLAALYDLLPPSGDKRPRPIGDWNSAGVVVRGRHVEHWLNGKKVLEYERGSEAFRAVRAASKFKAVEGFGEAPRGHILLQDHGDEVSFRNIRLRRLEVSR